VIFICVLCTLRTQISRSTCNLNSQQRDEFAVAGLAAAATPSIFNYALAAASKPIASVYSTPPTFNIYVHSLVLKKLKSLGGLKAVETRAIARAAAVYAVVDESNGYCE
jgi:phosphoserine aminotransferase